MDKAELSKRTRFFAVRVFKLVEKFPRTEGSRVIINQLLRSSSSVAANYRAVNRAKSKSDFVNKLKIVLEEADESNFWLAFSSDVGLVKPDNVELKFLLQESNEFVAMFAASVKTINLKSKILNFIYESYREHSRPPNP
jgi:four helix bundle protein